LADIPILSANWSKIELNVLWTVTWGREFCQLRPTFPDKPLIKTYDALCESCRSIASLQILFLEIFKCVDTFWSFIISKSVSRNRIDVSSHHWTRARAGLSELRLPRALHALFLRTILTNASPWTRTWPRALCLAVSLQAASRSVSRTGRGPWWPRADALHAEPPCACRPATWRLRDLKRAVASSSSLWSSQAHRKVSCNSPPPRPVSRMPSPSRTSSTQPAPAGPLLFLL
jgi:hypothetical protein